VRLGSAEDSKDDVVEPGAGPEQEASLDGAQVMEMRVS